MALFMSNDVVYSGRYGSAARSNCRDCGRTQHYDCTGEYIVPCPFNNGPAPRRNRGGGNSQIANVVINGDSYGASRRDSGRSHRHHGGHSHRRQDDDITRWPCRDCDGDHEGHKDYKGMCLSIMRVDPYKRREKIHKAAVGRMNWRTTGKVQKKIKKSSTPVSVIACDLGRNHKTSHPRARPSSSNPHERDMVGGGPRTPPRRTRPASTNAPKKHRVGNGINIVQIQQIQSHRSSSGGTGALANGNGGGYGIRKKDYGIPIGYSRGVTYSQRVNPSGYLVFR